MEKLQEVLLIDDSEIDNMIHTRLLKELQLTDNVISFLNGRTALGYLKDWLNNHNSQIPEVIFLDLSMPIMDGWSFLSEYEKLIHQYNLNTRLFVVSCTINKKEINKALSNKSVIDFISKPVTPEYLKNLPSHTIKLK